MHKPGCCLWQAKERKKWTYPLIFQNISYVQQVDLKMHGPRIFLENMSNSSLGFMWVMKIRNSWWRIRRAPRLFATHWAGLMISAWPGFVSELHAHCLLFSRPRWAADGPATAQRLLSPAAFVLFLSSASRCTLARARPPFLLDYDRHEFSRSDS